uniref:Uncharacterized protein n=1 Tax=Panagrolaimus sp. JU765 TaxID=591449 RepID=A0AC34QW62_9BILA
MSIQLLQKSLEYINENDGIIENARKRKAKKPAIIEEKELVKNLDDRFDFDVDSCKLLKKKRNEVHKHEGDVSVLFSHKDAKNGYSYVEQFRDTRPPDVAKHNKKYLKRSEKYQLPDGVVKYVVGPVLKSERKKKQMCEKRLAMRGTLYDPKPSKPKDSSVFTDADFDNIPNGCKNMVGTKVNKLI